MKTENKPESGMKSGMKTKNKPESGMESGIEAGLTSLTN